MLCTVRPTHISSTQGQTAHNIVLGAEFQTHSVFFCRINRQTEAADERRICLLKHCVCLIDPQTLLCFTKFLFQKNMCALLSLQGAWFHFPFDTSYGVTDRSGIQAASRQYRVLTFPT